MTLGIGLLGCGTVGGALATLLADQPDLALRSVAVRSATKARAAAISSELLTTDAQAVVDRDDVDIVVEVIGGIEPAKSLIVSALKAGKPVVTANKELISNCGAELMRVADDAGVDLLFEAAVAGAIPIVRALRASLSGEDISRITGIVNGTTNYILTKMTEDGADYSAALSEAQRLGYAERDPTADVEGFDAGAKAAIMASIAFNADVVAGDVYHEGISSITATDIDFAQRLGHQIKLLAIAEQFLVDGKQSVGVRVHPAMVPNSHPLASVRDSFNAVFVEGAASGELMFYGRGAGGAPTASAVLGDVLEASAALRQGGHRPVSVGPRVPIKPIDDLPSAFYVNLEVTDAAGVLAQVAGALGQHGVSIRTMEQHDLHDVEHDANGGTARLVFITHAAPERNLRETLTAFKGMKVVRGVGSVLRVIGQ
ncbi:MAG: homoserine dehydrogenase [Acidimicrobiales bacterium]|nr:homoserine dehydrogenase [Acidimicrobiales bacterium]